MCGKRFKRLTKAHLQTHGYTAARYARLFSQDASAPPVSRARTGLPAGCSNGESSASSSRQAPPGELVRVVASHLEARPEFVASLADEVAAYIMAGPVRDRLRVALLGLISARLELHGQAVARLDATNRELGADWRITQGGENGGPTPTKDLVGIASQTLAELKTGEDMVLKAIKLAIDEAKTPPAQVAAGSPLDQYSGRDEVLQVPSSISAAERETVRTLLSSLAAGATARAQVLDADSARPVEAEVVTPEPVEESGGIAPTMPDADEPF